ncbi:MAG: hypothetical protein LBG90_08415 [Spirochaetaceae bacterium]|jgi:hypothetical protein|nr:hypothetical protein [Spirochaetaceae bacterium]
MNDSFTDELPLSELAGNPERVFGRDAMNGTLHFCSPAHGGWGVVRVACLLPETQLLFVCPEACGRHGAIAALEQGYRRKITYLCIDDQEIILGGYEAEIERALDDIMAKVQPRPKAVLLFLPCIDDLLAGDHTSAMKRLEQKHCVPIRLARMNPIMLDNKMTPMLRVQKALYEFLPETPEKDRGIIILGAFRPPSRDSELAGLVERLGFGPIRHPEFCSDFEEFKKFSKSSGALTIRPEGTAAADYLKTRGIPPVFAPVAFDSASIIERYQRILTFLSALPGAAGGIISAEDIFRPTAEETAVKLQQTAEVLQGASIAVDATVTASPFSLALALVQGGIRVNRIYANYLPSHERDALKKLAGLDGSIIGANPNHARKHGRRPSEPLADIALGFEAGYATSAARTVPLAFDEQRYGFEGFQKILDALADAVSERKTPDLREQIKAYGLVV